MASPRKAPLADSDRNRQPPRQQLPNSYDPASFKPVTFTPDMPRFPYNPSIRLQPPASTNSTATSPSLASNSPSPTRPSSRAELAPFNYHSQPTRGPVIPPIIASSRKRLSSEAFPAELPPIIDVQPGRGNPPHASYGPEQRTHLPIQLAPPPPPPPLQRDSRNSLDFILHKPSPAETRPPAPPAPPPVPVLRSQTIAQLPPPPQSYTLPLQDHAPRPYSNLYETGQVMTAPEAIAQQQQMQQQQQLELEQSVDPRVKRLKPNIEIPREIDVHMVRLDGEPHNVPVYDTCDTVREKIRVLLRTDGITQAAFLRELGKVYDPPRKLQSKSLNDFLVKGGPRAGNTSCIYYSGYVFFEKKRIRDGAPRSKLRATMEEIYTPKGCNTTEVRNRVYARVGERIWEDEYGRVHTS